MALTTYNGFIDRLSDDFGLMSIIWDEIQTVTVNATGTNLAVQRLGQILALPSLPTGVTAYIPSMAFAHSSTVSLCFLLAKLISLGTVDLTLGSGNFADGSAMPTRTELGASNVTASAVLCEVTNSGGLPASPGTLVFTYTDQDGNTGQTSTTVTMGASAPIRSAWFHPLAAGDWGVQDITAATPGTVSQASGVIQLWGLDPLAMFPATPAGAVGADMLLNDFNPARLGAADVVGLFILGSTATKAVTGFMNFVGED